MLPVMIGIALMMAQLANLGVQAERPERPEAPNLANLFGAKPPAAPPKDSAGGAKDTAAEFERCCSAWDKVPDQMKIPGLRDKLMKVNNNCPSFDTVEDPGKCEAARNANAAEFERCCKAWDKMPDQMKIPGLMDKLMKDKNNCPDFDTGKDPEKCAAAQSAAAGEEALDGNSGGEIEWKSEVDPGAWQQAKADITKQLKDLQKLEVSVDKETEEMRSMGPAIFEDIIKNAQKEGFMSEEEDVVSLVDQWKRIVVPPEFSKLFTTNKEGKAKVPTKVIGEIMPQPALFEKRIGALQKFFAMMHIEGSAFLMTSEDGFLKWPTRMLSGQSSFGSVLDSLADTWKEKCSTCPVDKSCLSPSASLGCQARQAIAFDPTGPLDQATWEVLNFAWRCIDTPELLSEFAAKKCKTRAPSDATFDQKKQMLKEFLLSEESSFKKVPKATFDVSERGWFSKQILDTQLSILAQIIGRCDLDPAEVDGPMTPADLDEGKLKLAAMKKTHGMSYERHMTQWLQIEGFGGAYAKNISAAIRQMQGIRSRKFIQWPTCPVGYLDCLGGKVRHYLFDELSQEDTAVNMMEAASVSWGTTDVLAATALLAPVQEVSMAAERQELKEASDKLLKEISKVKYVGVKIAKEVYSP